MKTEVTNAISELKNQFSDASFVIREDCSGGAYVRIESVKLDQKYDPPSTWIGFHISAQYPYADIYPIFIDGNVARVDGKVFDNPVTTGHQFEGKTAIQISRRSNFAQNGSQRAVTKILKILNFMENLP